MDDSTRGPVECYAVLLVCATSDIATDATRACGYLKKHKRIEGDFAVV